MTSKRGWHLAGLFLASSATLLLENLDARLLSVLTWYHLSFFAVSIAMLGMAAGGVSVYRHARWFQGDPAPSRLAHVCFAFAVSIPLSHVANLYIPIPVLSVLSFGRLLSIAAATIVLAIPFFLAGVTVTVALTRVGGTIGRLYAADLIGAAAGCLLIIPLLNSAPISAAAFIAGSLAAVAASCFYRFAGRGWIASLSVALILVASAALNVPRLDIVRAKGIPVPLNVVQYSAWNTHSHVLALKPFRGPASLWGPGKGADQFEVMSSLMFVDGAAGTVVTQWDGDVSSIPWVEYDVTYLPYHLRSGDAAIIGVGGGRDILSALRAGSTSVTGIEVNGIFVSMLRESHRDFAGIGARKDVTLIHDEARSYLTRSHKRFDVLQMSLVDTWAATGAGAFTLSENGLYTVEAWKVFLDSLKPAGIFSVSRWVSPSRVSEARRLLSLAVATMLQRSYPQPARHIVLAARRSVATLLLSPEPFSPADCARLREVGERYGFTFLVAPWQSTERPDMRAIVTSRSLDQLRAAVADPLFDYSPPTDRRPYFFNMLKPAGIFTAGDVGKGVLGGNLQATATLIVLFVLSATLVASIVVWPLLRSGLPSLSVRDFLLSLAYFSQIGLGFMLIQIALMQRFSIFLGHPTYSLAIILCSMILFTGLGSLASDALPTRRRVWLIVLAAGIAATVFGVAAAIQPIIDATIQFSLSVRCGIVIGVTAPLSFLLGFCFPVGLRLVDRRSHDATAWMWGVNGACGVLGSVVAVMISMWLGIDTNFLTAGLLYGALIVPVIGLAGDR